MRYPDDNIAIQPFILWSNSDPTRWLLIWLIMVSLTLVSLYEQAAGSVDIAMWAAIAVGSMAFTVVTCMKMSQSHEMNLLTRRQDHELAITALSDDEPRRLRA